MKRAYLPAISEEAAEEVMEEEKDKNPKKTKKQR